MSQTTDPSAAERAYLDTKRRIITGELPGGASLSEIAVCQELGLSRTPVHEAFLRLAAEQLLALESRKGAVVRPMSPSEADDVVEMREAVEAAAARRAVSTDVTALVADLRSLLAAQQDALSRGDVDAFLEADDAFHTAVITASRNPIAAHFSGLLHDRAHRLRHHVLRVRPDHLEVTFHDHEALADAVEQRDGDAYAAVLSRHVGILRGVL